ncbi:hypothetical protein B0H11DRAFT_1981991 [Mycena galericulata]|nr:hypothetical protein B0H11DRAFT_1981991 [Mycena galericulata]
MNSLNLTALLLVPRMLAHVASTSTTFAFSQPFQVACDKIRSSAAPHKGKNDGLGNEPAHHPWEAVNSRLKPVKACARASMLRPGKTRSNRSRRAAWQS